LTESAGRLPSMQRPGASTALGLRSVEIEMERTPNQITGANSRPAGQFESRGLRPRAPVVGSRSRHHGGAAVAQFCRSATSATTAMKTRNTLLAILLTTPSVTADTISGLFPSGVDDLGSPLAIGVADPHYKLNGGAAITATPAPAWISVAGPRWICTTERSRGQASILPISLDQTSMILLEVAPCRDNCASNIPAPSTT
jgi:hypothetical protein